MIIVFILLVIWANQVEHFSDIIKTHNIGNNWHQRFPYMVNQRYAYNDVPIASFPSINTYANLGELLIGNTKYEKDQIYGYDYHDYYDKV